MNNIIEFKKDCIMKTRIDTITDISLSHDYKIMEDMIEGYFDVSGEYKITPSSIQKEEFMYTIPFTIALSSMIDKSSINLTIKDFKYSTNKDILHLNMFLSMDYQELPVQEEVHEEEEEMEDIMELNEFQDTLEKEIEDEVSKDEELMEETFNKTSEVEEEEEMSMDNIDELISSMDDIKTSEFHNDVMLDNVSKEVETTQVHTELEEKDTEVLNSIISSGEEAFYKYKIYIMREEDTIESVAIKYNVTLDDLKEYNDLASINIGDKIIIPFVNEQCD